MKKSTAVIRLAFISWMLAGCAAEAPPQESGSNPPATAESQESVAGETIEFPEYGIALVCPPGFVKSDKFAGFMEEGNTGAIMLRYLPAPFEEMRPTFQPEDMKQKNPNITIFLHQEKQVEGLDGYLTETNALQGLQGLRIWNLGFGDDRQTYIVAAIVPKERAEELRATFEQCLESVTIVPRVRPSYHEYEVIEGLKETPETFVPGATLMSVSGTEADVTGDSIRFMILPVRDPRDVSEVLPVVARSQLASHAVVTADSIESEQEVKIDGLKGVELKVHGVSRKAADKPVSVYLVVLALPGGGYVNLVGVCPQAVEAEWFPKFEQGAKSYRIKKAP